NRDDELHPRKAYREHHEGTVSRGGAETRRGVALFSATPRLRVNMYSGCHAAPTYRGDHPAHLSGARARQAGGVSDARAWEGERVRVWGALHAHALRGVAGAAGEGEDRL